MHSKKKKIQLLGKLKQEDYFSLRVWGQPKQYKKTPSYKRDTET